MTSPARSRRNRSSSVARRRRDQLGLRATSPRAPRRCAGPRARRRPRGSRRPRSGTWLQPRTRRAWTGRRRSTGWPFSSCIARIFGSTPCPRSARRPRRACPSARARVATGPRPRSRCASRTVPRAGPSGSPFSSARSATTRIVSSSVSRLSFALRRDVDELVVAAPLGRDHAVLGELGADPVGLASSLSILLTATTIGTSAALAWSSASSVCGITPSSAATTSTTMSVTLRAAGAHRGERLVARRIDERDLAGRATCDLVGADVLRDAAGLAGRDVGLADRVEQLGLAVVDVTHDGDHGERGGRGLSGSTASSSSSSLELVLDADDRRRV